MEILRIENLTKRFSQNYVLDNLSLAIEEGEKVNISGHSGIGKTTLFRLILGFEKPEKGAIYFKGEKLTDESVWRIRKQIAYVPQNLNIGTGKVTSLFDETMNYKANSSLKKIKRTNIADLFEQFGLPNEVLTQNIEELSGGEKQRISIINALLLQRNVFLLDEITSALDQKLKEEILDYFLKNKEFTVIYISHDSYLPENCHIRTLKLDENERSR